jgi:hypothetical protein
MGTQFANPDRLHGQLLERWYRRSPIEIEQGRRAAKERVYADFFGVPQLPGVQVPSDEPAAATHRRQNVVVSTPVAGSESRAWHPMRAQRSAIRPLDHDDHARAFGRSTSSAFDCITCHERTPPPFMPPLPFLPGGFPFLRETPRDPPGTGRPKRRLPQCDVQYERDSDTCRSLLSGAARGRCWASASERRAYCTSHDGEVGWPDLETQ